MNYSLPQSNKDKIWEERYQVAVASALNSAQSTGPVLVKPRAKYAGWCWNVYQRK